jgi:hypothetical protein
MGLLARAMEGVEHFTNPLHIYSYMHGAGIGKELALNISRIYENYFYKGTVVPFSRFLHEYDL